MDFQNMEYSHKILDTMATKKKGIDKLIHCYMAWVLLTWAQHNVLQK